MSHDTAVVPTLLDEKVDTIQESRADGALRN